jgi:hypothetical protein
MKKLVAASLVALAVALPGAVQAQFMDIVAIVSGIGDADFQRAAQRLDSAPSVRIVRLSTLAGAQQNADRVAGVYDLKRRELNYLHAQIYLNPIARHAIAYAGVSIDQIISIYTPGDGAATLYADDINY